MRENIYQHLLKRINEGDSIVLKTIIRGEEGNIQDMKRSVESMDQLKTESLIKVKPLLELTGDNKIIKEPVFPKERLVILGGGHIALALCDFATKCGFEVYVVDDRPAFANNDRFPQAKKVICDQFEKAILDLKITAYDYVVIITRGHRHDAECLRTILPGTFPLYLGMIGSRRRVRGLFDMLIEEGYDASKIARICSPIGLNIGGITPEEISVSILGELISYKHIPQEKQINRYVNASDLDYDMIEYLANNHDPKAIVTVIQTKGSTPRDTGAKMAVDSHGHITGTIGGGCSEGAIIRDAIDIIGTGTYKTAFIDMTGDVAESEGMVCGGTMLVLIEDGCEE